MPLHKVPLALSRSLGSLEISWHRRGQQESFQSPGTTTRFLILKVERKPSSLAPPSTNKPQNSDDDDDDDDDETATYINNIQYVVCTWTKINTFATQQARRPQPYGPKHPLERPCIWGLLRPKDWKSSVLYRGLISTPLLGSP